jgi:hypothetical protein
MSVHPHDFPQPAPERPQPAKSIAGWIVGFTFLIALGGVLLLYNGEDGSPKSGDNPPNVVSGSK